MAILLCPVKGRFAVLSIHWRHADHWSLTLNRQNQRFAVSSNKQRNHRLCCQTEELCDIGSDCRTYRQARGKNTAGDTGKVRYVTTPIYRPVYLGAPAGWRQSPGECHCRVSRQKNEWSGTPPTCPPAVCKQRAAKAVRRSVAQIASMPGRPVERTSPPASPRA